jgi:hypothetical protein
MELVYSVILPFSTKIDVGSIVKYHTKKYTAVPYSASYHTAQYHITVHQFTTHHIAIAQ